VRQRLYEEIAEGTLRIQTEGEVTGQINGLSVVMTGPSRITATTRLGEGEVVDIEREVEMGGPLHSKGVFILASFLRKGLTGGQGVIIPAANVRNLMLEPRVLKAVAEGHFRIHAVERVDEALELLTGQTAGEPDPAGAFPEDSLNGRIQRRLAELARIRHAFGESARRDGGAAV